VTLLPVAWCAGETMEAIEMPDRWFAYGVQRPPETGPSGSRLFGALAGAARKIHCERRAGA
jgi:putative glutamine amidotransferase